MIERIIIGLLAVLIQSLKPEVLKKATDAMLDAIEDAVKESENTVDDKIVLPLCRKIREAWQIPDDD